MSWGALLQDTSDFFSKKRLILRFATPEKTQLSSKFSARLDLVAQAYYQDKALWWVLAEANNMIYPFEETTADATIILPSASAIETYSQQLDESIESEAEEA